MLEINQILKHSDSKKLYRILISDNDYTYWIDIHGKSVFPELIETPNILDMLLNKALIKTEDPFAKSFLMKIRKNSNDWIKRENAWNLIKKEIDSTKLFSSQGRGIAYKELLKDPKTKTTRQTFYRHLRRFWQSGMVKNALIPRFFNCGEKGGNKKTTGKKLGRPRVVKFGIGCNITDDIKKVFRLEIEDKILIKDQEYTLVDAHAFAIIAIKCLASFKSIYDLPTIEQFTYFYKREYSEVDALKKQYSETIYNKDIKPLTSTSTIDTLGPGYKYQIDATIGDLFLVSTKDRTRIVGRPVIYMVLDVYSRMVTGLYIGFEGPSWVSAKLALANTVENKVQFCQKYGIEISEKDWPVEGLPSSLLADKGEFLGANVETFTSAYGVRIENATARRGDCKGIVERYFRTVQESYKPYAPGVVTPITSRKKGGFDYRKDAKYTIDEFTHLIILSVLWHNNYQTIQKYDRCEHLPPSVPTVPIALWSWGLANLTGRLKSAEHKLLKVNLMPHVEATTSNFGIHLFGCYFSCVEARELGWFHRRTERKITKVTIAYDLTNTNNVYIRPNNSYDEYWVCNLTDRSRRFKDLTFWDVFSLRKEEKKTDAKAYQLGCVEKGILLKKMQQAKIRAEKLQPGKLKINAMNGGKTIRENKELEKKIEREKHQPVDNSNSTTNTSKEQSEISNKFCAPPGFSNILFGGQSSE